MSVPIYVITNVLRKKKMGGGVPLVLSCVRNASLKTKLLE